MAKRFSETSKYVRDDQTNAVLSIDHDGLNAYKKKKMQQHIFEETVNDVQELKSDMNEIKSMLSEILYSRGN